MSRDFDREYRAHHQEVDNRLTRITMAVAAVLFIAFIRADRVLVDDAALLQTVIGVRAAFALICLGMFVALRTLKDGLLSDIAILSWCLVLVGTMAYVNTSRPPGYIGFLITDVIVVMAIFTTIRMPIALQLIPTLLLSVVSLRRLLAMTEVAAVPTAVAALGFGAAIALGLVSSWQFDSSRYRQYLLLLQARDLRSGLDEAREEIHALSDGRPVHTICPDCLEKHQIER